MTDRHAVRPPIITADDADVSTYSSLEAVEHYVEAYDAFSGQIHFFDADGTVLNPVREGKYEYSLHPSAHRDPEALRKHLLIYLRQVSPEDPAELAGLSLSDLLQAADTRARWD